MDHNETFSTFLLTRTPLGGGRGQNLPLPDFRDNSKTVEDIDKNLGYLILHQFDIDRGRFNEICLIFWGKNAFCDVTTSHFWSKSSQHLEIHQRFIFEANRPKEAS